MKININYIIIIIILFFIIYKLNIFKSFQIKESYENDKNKLYENLKNEYMNMFKDYENNRNSCSFLYMYYIINNMLTRNNIDDFILYSQLFCPVSGSLISPDREIYEISLNRLYTKEMVKGYVSVCCTPCLCDLIKYAKVEKYRFNFNFSKYTFNSFDVITIEDPCNYTNDINKYINEVTCVTCNNNKIQNGFLSDSGRLIIGILHNKETIDKFNKNSKIVKQNEYQTFCNQRNSMNIDELNYGMGDIFIKLSTIKNYI